MRNRSAGSGRWSGSGSRWARRHRCRTEVDRRAVRGVRRPGARAAPAAARRSASVSTSRTQPGQSPGQRRPRRRPGAPPPSRGRSAGASARADGGEQRRPGAVGVGDEARGRPPAAAQRRGQLGRPQRRQVGGERGDGGPARRCGRRARAPGSARGPGSSATVRAPSAADHARPRRGSSVTTTTSATDRAGDARRRPCRPAARAPARRARSPSAVGQRAQPGLGDGEPLRRDDDRPAAHGPM